METIKAQILIDKDRHLSLKLPQELLLGYHKIDCSFP
jgi:hypothetical protein